ncbi:Protein rolling stone [Taenia crassiceps]|uniref:Protein rolling stone n=1 Tax=Taenia crassiceps TaxID=6207 RepID=A0ABR4QI19_9CEST
MEDTTEERRPCCSTTGKAFKYQFQCREFGFFSAVYNLFPFAQWMWMDGIIYPLYRFFISIGLLVWARSTKKLYYFLYATNWGFLMYTISSNAFAIFSTYFNCKKEKPVPKWFASVLWFFYELAMNTVLVTSLVYWAALWDPAYTRFYRPEARCKHILPATTVLLDMWVNGLPINLLHAIYPVILGIIYAVFSYVYYDTRDMHPIYPVLNWSKPGEAAGASALAITTSVLVHLLLFLLYIGRITLSYRLNGRGKATVEQWWNKGLEKETAKPETEVEAS